MKRWIRNSGVIPFVAGMVTMVVATALMAVLLLGVKSAMLCSCRTTTADAHDWWQQLGTPL
jgi:hypothetical protein